MSDARRVSIRKNRPGRWRGYIGGVRVIEFEDSATESAEAAANRWLAAPSKPQKQEPAKTEPARTEPAKAAAITIKTKGISDQEKATEKFQSAYRDMMSQLTAPGFIAVLCAHEAAHAIYFTLAGMKEFDTHPAELRYDPAIDDYTGSLAAIKVLDLPPWTEGEFSDWFFKVARAHAAGGVVARRLMPSSDGGDQDDRDRFKIICEKLNEDPNVHIDFEVVWKQAQESIAQDLQNQEVMTAIEKEALHLRPLLGL